MLGKERKKYWAEGELGFGAVSTQPQPASQGAQKLGWPYGVALSWKSGVGKLAHGPVAL